VFGASVVVCAGLNSAAWAQFDVGMGATGLMNGERVAEVFVPARAKGACKYKEYWYLFENYPSPYPGSRNPVSIVFTPFPKAQIPDYAKSLKSFRQHMKATHPNGYMIVVTAREMRPGCG
jgi:hypothetical protein